MGTASKALAPAVRLGWVHAPSPLAGAVAAEKEMSDRVSCTMDQLALAALLTSGQYDRHLCRMPTVYARRRAALVEAFTRQWPLGGDRTADGVADDVRPAAAHDGPGPLGEMGGDAVAGTP